MVQTTGPLIIDFILQWPAKTPRWMRMLQGFYMALWDYPFCPALGLQALSSLIGVATSFDRLVYLSDVFSPYL